jgi:hypothetical protein
MQVFESNLYMDQSRLIEGQALLHACGAFQTCVAKRPAASTTTTTSTSASGKPVGIPRESVPSASVPAFAGNVIISRSHYRSENCENAHRGTGSSIVWPGLDRKSVEAAHGPAHQH